MCVYSRGFMGDGPVPPPAFVVEQYMCQELFTAKSMICRITSSLPRKIRLRDVEDLQRCDTQCGCRAQREPEASGRRTSGHEICIGSRRVPSSGRRHLSTQPKAKEIDIVKRVFMLTAAVAALSLFRFARAAVAAARARGEKQELIHEIRRWEDEGGNAAIPAPKRSAIPGVTS
jgi:hypothetical protein